MIIFTQLELTLRIVKFCSSMRGVIIWMNIFFLLFRSSISDKLFGSLHRNIGANLFCLFLGSGYFWSVSSKSLAIFFDSDAFERFNLFSSPLFSKNIGITTGIASEPPKVTFSIQLRGIKKLAIPVISKKIATIKILDNFLFADSPKIIFLHSCCDNLFHFGNIVSQHIFDTHL